MATIATLSVNLVTKTQGFVSGLGRAAKSVSKFAAPIVSGALKVAKFASIIGVGAVAALTALTVKAFRAMDAMAKMSDRLGISTEKLAAFQHAAELTGVSAGSLEKGLEKMVRRVGLFADGTGAAAIRLKQLGFAQEELANLSTADQFAEIAERIKELPTHAERSAAAFEIFGNKGQELLPILMGGAAGMEAMQVEAEKLGLAFSRVDAAQIENMNDSITRMKAVLAGLGRSIATKVAPFVEFVVEKFVEWATAGDGVRAKVGGAFKFIIKVVSKAADVLLVLQIGWKATQHVVAGAIAGIIGMQNLWVKAAGKMLEFFGFEFQQGIVDAFDQIAQSVIETADTFGAELDEMIGRPWPSEAAENFFADIEAAATESAESVAAAGESMSDFTGFLEDTSAADKMLKDQQRRADAIIQSTRTNAEKLASALEELDVLQLTGLLDDETFARALKQAREKFGEEIEKPKVFDAGAVGALTMGSSGASSAIAAFERGKVATDQIAKESLGESKSQTMILRRLLEAATSDPEKLVTLGT